jgi:ADP-ribosyl-[dinitrogen reductase] hydrolase
MPYHNQNKDYTEAIKAALFGVAVGDALGVPVEFKSRNLLKGNPVSDMIGYGTYNLPEGTWSDDSSLTFCLAEALTQDFDLHTIGQNFVKWHQENFWTPRGVVFDIGFSTSTALHKIADGEKPELAGGTSESSNGNGSLMRILPLLFYLRDKPVDERYDITKSVSSITHGHIYSVICCFYYLEFARQLLEGKDKYEAYSNLQTTVTEHLESRAIGPDAMALLGRLLHGRVDELGEDAIQSSGYVLHTLEASIWCLLTTDNYRDAVVKAVNLGEDTDTTGAVTGGLAGLYYGLGSIPVNWLTPLARRNDIEDLAVRLAGKLGGA